MIAIYSRRQTKKPHISVKLFSVTSSGEMSNFLPEDLECELQLEIIDKH